MKLNDINQNEITHLVNRLRNGALKDTGFEISVEKIKYDGDTFYEYTVTNGKFTIVMARTKQQEQIVMLDVYLLLNNPYFNQMLETCKAYQDCYEIANKFADNDSKAKQTASIIKQKLNELKVIDINYGSYEYEKFGMERWTPKLYCSDILEFHKATKDIKNLTDSLSNIDGYLILKYDFEIENYDPYVIYPKQNNKNSNNDESGRF